MKKFIIKETTAVWVEFSRIVEAENRAEALNAFYSGDSVEYCAPLILDSLDNHPSEISIEVL
jgi:hypothetical protein